MPAVLHMALDQAWELQSYLISMQWSNLQCDYGVSCRTKAANSGKTCLLSKNGALVLSHYHFSNILFTTNEWTNLQTHLGMKLLRLNYQQWSWHKNWSDNIFDIFLEKLETILQKVSKILESLFQCSTLEFMKPICINGSFPWCQKPKYPQIKN